MEYIVTRTSNWLEEKPCEEAYTAKGEYWDVRTLSEDQYNIKFGYRGTWRSKGSNNRILDNGHIARFMNHYDFWCIEMKTIDDLMAFIDKHGEVIISPPRYEWEYPNIEIYDNYRE
jgi:hypothetical protein